VRQVGYIQGWDRLFCAEMQGGEFTSVGSEYSHMTCLVARCKRSKLSSKMGNLSKCVCVILKYMKKLQELCDLRRVKSIKNTVFYFVPMITCARNRTLENSSQ